MSSVTYPVNLFQDTIQLKVYGETYFDVKRQKNHFLFVHAKNIQIELTRGKLNLNAYPDSLFTKLTILEGSAILHFNTESIPLRAGEQAVIGKTIYHIEKPTNLNPIINWIN